MAFGGKEKTYQAWNGIDKATYEANPKFNYSGAIYDANWENIIGFYDNETDNYRQNHYHLLWEQKLGKIWNLETTFHLTHGEGYYENYKQDAKFSKYDLPNIVENGNTITKTDFIRKKWLDNDFYGVVSNLYGNFENLNLNFGVAANQYFGRHFGNVSGVKYTDILSNRINDYNFKYKNSLNQLIVKLKNIDQEKYKNIVLEIEKEFQNERIEFYENWKDCPFKTLKNMPDTASVKNEKALLELLYPKSLD